MAEKRKPRKKKDPQENVPPPPEVATKEEYNIARWIRKNVPIKKTKFLNHQVEYFTACKGVDQLMDSPWSKPPKGGGEALFTTRESISEYLDLMLRHKFFHRARKIVVPESELNKNKKKKGGKEEEKDDGKKKKEEEKAEKEEPKPEENEENNDEGSALVGGDTSHAEGEKPEKKKGKKKKEEGEKKKRKIRLDMHLEQRFVDGNDAYVWLYEPTPYYYYFFGFLVVIAVIAICLFPLWPPSVRQGVYYLSLAAAGFLVAILALAVVRLVVYCAIWCLTFGRHNFWILPNLTEDVGFLQSFWPLYKYEYKGSSKDDSKGKDQDKDSNDEDSQDKDSAKEGSDKENSESEGSQPSQTDKDYEILDREELDT